MLGCFHFAVGNFPEVLMSRGEDQMKPELPFIQGSEVAGTRVDTGERVAGFSILGGYAEQAVCSQDTLFSLPDNVSFEAGAALLMNYLTVDFALARRSFLQPEQTLLVHGAAGGIGGSGLAVRWPRREASTVGANKRAVYQGRYAMLERLAQELATGIVAPRTESALRPAASPR